MKQRKRILLYGFGPYRQFRDNITARIVRSLPAQPGLKKVIFPVRFERRQFIEALRRCKPDIVLGLGQSTRKKIEIESRAANRKRATNSAHLISSRGPRWLPATLPLKLSRAARRSVNAGDYVCNYSMYVMLDHIRKNGGRIRYGFVHIPSDCDPRATALLIARTIRNLTKLKNSVKRKSSRGRRSLRLGASSRA